jgi:Fe-S-cluster-containing dehydrogenase component
MTDRRLFMQNGLVALVSATGIAGGSAAAPAGQAAPRWGMVIDLNRCTGCQACVVACKTQNRSAPDRFNTRILAIEDVGRRGSRVTFTPIQCNHCEDPPCVKACSANATFKLPNGIVVTDWDKCVPLGSCVTACPYEARYLDPRHGHKVDKCDFCADRLAKGLLPACVEACDAKARVFGDFDAPQGELADYLKRMDLVHRRAELGLKSRVLYVPHRKHSTGGVA